MKTFKLSRSFYLVVASLVSFALIATYLIFAALPEEAPGNIPQITGEYAPDRLIVRFAPGTGKDKEKEIASKNGLEEVNNIQKLEARVLKIKDKGDVASKIFGLSKNKHVAYAEPDYVVKSNLIPDDTYYGTTQARNMDNISIPAAWDITTGTTNSIVAVLDTGVLQTHSDLVATGRFLLGIDLAYNDADPNDVNGHGTMVAGVIAAIGNNAMGVAGINWKTRLMPVKVLDDTGSGYTSTVSNGVVWATEHGANVINMSLGSTYPSTTLENAVNYAYEKNLTILAASGNDSRANGVSYPAAYENCIAVGAIDQNSVKASFSNGGAQLDVVAPGVSVSTTKNTNTYAYFSGTSASTPVVTGVASLMKAANPSLSNSLIKSALTQSATDLGPAGFDTDYGHGKVNAQSAVSLALNPSAINLPTDATAPNVIIPGELEGTTIKGIINLPVTATDNVAVKTASLYIDERFAGSTTMFPYIFSVDTTLLADRIHTFRAEATDLAGNTGRSNTVTMVVQNYPTTTTTTLPGPTTTVVSTTTTTPPNPIDEILPTVVFNSPANGTNVSRSVYVRVTANDNVSIKLLTVYLNGKLIRSSQNLGPTSIIDMNYKLSNKNSVVGQNTLTAYATDTSGNVSTTSVQFIRK